jgi:hypothetical protein
MHKDIVTYYKGEDIHPALAAAFDWADQTVFRHLQPDATTPILAGGALRSYFSKTPVRDYDLYFPTQEKYIAATNGLHSPHWRKMDTKSQDSTLYEYAAIGVNVMGSHRPSVETLAFNFVHRKYCDTPEDVIKDYDFTVCMCGINRDQISFHPDYFLDLQTRKLRINNIEDPLNSLWRVQKYNGYGFKMDEAEMWRIVETVHSLPSLPNVDVTIEEPQGTAVPVTSIFSGS